MITEPTPASNAALTGATVDPHMLAGLTRLRTVMDRIAHEGDFQAVDSLLALTAASNVPAQLTELAEAFARMVVQLEAREFQLACSIDDLQRVKQELEAANHDPLTGLANRVIARDRLNQALLAARRCAEGEGGCVAVLFLDLDKFKAVNDTLGHAAGDDLLRQVAQRIRACTRAADTVARLGGDEFLCVLPALDDVGPARDLATRLVQCLQQPFDLATGQVAHIGTSVGLAAAPAHGDAVDDLIAKADAALYAVKRAGRNAYRVYDPSLA